LELNNINGLILIIFIAVGCRGNENIIHKTILNGKYQVSIPETDYYFKIDTSRLYRGSQEMIYLYSDSLNAGIELFFGYSNPSQYYFDVLDFYSDDIELQFKGPLKKEFISFNKKYGPNGEILSIYYLDDNELEKMVLRYL